MEGAAFIAALPYVVAGVTALWATVEVALNRENIQAAGEACGAGIQAAVDNLGLFLSKKGGASDKSLLDGIKGKASEWQKDKDKIRSEPGSQGLGHWGDTSGGLEEAIARDLERLGPKVRQEAKEYLEAGYPELLDALEK